MAHYGQGAVQINPIPYPYGPVGYVLAVNSYGQLYWAAVGGVGGVTSVFGRTGPAVIAASGDYTPTMVGFSAYPIVIGTDTTPAIVSNPGVGQKAVTNIVYDPTTGQYVFSHA
jgi:hypothetical protein